jgi:cysteine synthase A
MKQSCRTARIFEDNTFSIGRTPLVRLKRLTVGCRATVLAKVEGRNPSFSVKCRVGAAMVWEAERRELLKPSMTIVEPTSGNTGIALAFVGAARGYRVMLTMPDTMSQERQRVLAAFGAEVVLTEGRQAMAGAIAKAQELSASNPKRYYMPQQFTNPANPAIHEQTTGPEIWEDTGGQVDVVVCGVGTGGTLTGIARYLKLAKGRNLLAVAVEPRESAVISQTLAGKPLRPGLHRIQGIGAGFIPEVLALSLVDRVEQVDSDEAEEFTRRLAREEGLLCGTSSGAAVAVALRLARQTALRGRTIVAILPDAGERYLSTGLFPKCGETTRVKR